MTTITTCPADGSVIPHRKVTRAWLALIASRSTARALALVLLDVALFVGGMTVTVVARSPLF